MSLIAVPVLPPTIGLSEPIRRQLKPRLVPPPGRESRLSTFLIQKERRQLLKQLAHDEAAILKNVKRGPVPQPLGAPMIAAFYATWQETGLHSLRANADKLTHLFPLWLGLSPDARHIDTRDWNPALTPHNLDVLRIARQHALLVMPVLSNAHEGSFDAALAHQLLADPARQVVLANKIATWLRQHGFAGVNLDLENLANGDEARVPAFLARLHHVLARQGLVLVFDLEAEGNVPDPAAVARSSDYVVLMAYDQHYMAGEAGPLCGVELYR